jgi:tRNA nucleotidyltransferase (CCA-adding enzyme)
VLCHDLGKPASTFTDDEGRIRAHGHDAAGEAPTRSFLARLTRQKQLVEDVVSLVRTHMQPAMLHKGKAGMGAIRRLSTRTRIDRLARVARADMRGTPPKPHDEIPCDWLLEQAAELAVQAQGPRPIIQGRHLMKLGLQPGPDFAPILHKLFEAQLDGEFGDEAGGLEMARRLIGAKD